jgi:hypothetical protein
MSCSVTAAASSSGEGCIGAPKSTVIATCRVPSARGRPLVNSRWLPHTAPGTIGTPARWAMRTVPLLPGSGTNDRLMVASGNMPTSSPSRSSPTAWSMLAVGSPARSTGMWRIARISGPETGWSKVSCLAANRTRRRPGAWRTP